VRKSAVKHKKDRPETIAEVLSWQRLKTSYLMLGLCHACAAQAAYGHQLGFTLINAPCSGCLPLVRSLPRPGPAGSPWRRMGAARNVARSVSATRDLPPENETDFARGWLAARAAT
jgi:hypothetical protein